MKKEVIIFFIFVLILTGFVLASYSIEDYSIDTKYGPLDTLRGWIEISLDNENSNSTFESSFENADDEIFSSTATLMTLIKGDSDFIYTCDPVSCATDYYASTPETTKTFTLDAEESAVVGFKISGGMISDVSDFSINFQSNAGASSVSQLLIDILNNEEKEWQAYGATGDFGGARYGCYTSPKGQAGTVIF